MMASAWIRTFLLITLIAGVGCAPTVPAPVAPIPTPTIDVDRLIQRGCYSCLEQAYDLLTRSPAPSSSLTFEVTLLLATRSKELGLPHEPWLERARNTMPAGPEWANYLAIVQAIAIDPLSNDRDITFAETMKYRPTGEMVAGWRAYLTAGPGSPLLRAYLDLALVCQVPTDNREGIINAVLERFAEVPLIAYRAGLCRPPQAPHLVRARELEPDFVDVDYALGRYALDIPLQPDQDEALRRFLSARAAFPQSPAILAGLGALRRDREEWVEAVEAYEGAIAIVPTHRDALLGRVVALSHLGLHDQAVQGADRIIDLGSWFTGEAYYWRSWNLYHLARIPEARADIDRAKRLMRNASVLVLSGMIEWHDHRLEAAESELQNALTLDAGQCEAAFLLGTVRAERRQWSPGAAAFDLAKRCYDLSITLRNEAIARITAGPGSEAGKARQIARQQRVIVEESQHRDESAANAMQLQTRAGG